MRQEGEKDAAAALPLRETYREVSGPAWALVATCRVPGKITE